MQIQFTPFPELLTERLQLRQLAMSDEQEIYIQRSDARILQYINRPKANNLEDARIFIQKIITNIAQNESIYWAIALKNNPVLIGTVCLWNIVPETSSIEIGYSLHPDFQGQGYMQEALEAVVEYGFDVMQAKTIEAFTNPANAASIRLLQKNNFICRGEEEGFLVYILSR